MRETVFRRDCLRSTRLPIHFQARKAGKDVGLLATSGQAALSAAAIAADALPAPMTMHLPDGFGGRLRNTAADGEALSTAASNIRRTEFEPFDHSTT